MVALHELTLFLNAHHVCLQQKQLYIDLIHVRQLQEARQHTTTALCISVLQKKSATHLT